MAKSNGRAMTRAKHDAQLKGHLQQVLDVLQHLPGIAERNDRYLREFTERQRSIMNVLAPKPAEPAGLPGVRVPV